jgi:hypothetical protein
MTDSDDKHDDPAAEEGSAGSSDPGAKFRENPPDEQEQKEIEEERERRLDPENRPEGSEVDNTPRTFDQDEWKFDDGKGGSGGLVDPAEPASERGHGPNNDDGDSDSSDKSDTDSGDEKSDESDKESESA